MAVFSNFWPLRFSFGTLVTRKAGETVTFVKSHFLHYWWNVGALQQNRRWDFETNFNRKGINIEQNERILYMRNQARSVQYSDKKKEYTQKKNF